MGNIIVINLEKNKRGLESYKIFVRVLFIFLCIVIFLNIKNIIFLKNS